jgi:glycosyltransferase involved in cell wall biosynthesis
MRCASYCHREIVALRLSLIVTTYERPDALERVLASIAAQSQPPDELIIADDGSGDATRRVISDFARGCPYSFAYIRQTHEGFRLARLRNLALAAASGDYVVLIDGDMVLHPEFLADHRRNALPGWYCQGLRIPLTETATASVLAGASPPSFLQPGIAGRRRWHALHRPRWQPALRGLGRWLLAIKGCNQAFWRDDVLAINGYDEDFVGWGAEDKDLCWRLELAGIRRMGLLAGGIAYHLHHPPADRSCAEQNRQRFSATRAHRRPRAARGIDSWLDEFDEPDERA